MTRAGTTVLQCTQCVLFCFSISSCQFLTGTSDILKLARVSVMRGFFTNTNCETCGTLLYNNWNQRFAVSTVQFERTEKKREQFGPAGSLKLSRANKQDAFLQRARQEPRPVLRAVREDRAAELRGRRRRPGAPAGEVSAAGDHPRNRIIAVLAGPVTQPGVSLARAGPGP